MQQEYNKRAKGADYEEMAAEYLRNQGYEIIQKNYRNKQGEIDLIVKQHMEFGYSSLVYVEVKYRSNMAYGDPLEAVDFRKQKRISRAASYHYARFGAPYGMGCRFDVIAIYGSGKIIHVENAFDAISR